MFSSKRIGRFLNHLIAHAPKWYLIVPLLATIGIFFFGVLVDGTRPSVPFEDTSEPFIRPYTVGIILLYGNTIGLVIVAVHLLSNYFKTQQRSIDTISLPVNQIEQFTSLFIALFVAIPVLGLASSVLSFGLFKLFGFFGVFPKWIWMEDKFVLSVLPYFVFALFFFPLSFLRPKQTWIWGIGIMLGIGIILGTVFESGPDFLSTERIDLSAYTDQLPKGDKVYGAHYIYNIYDYPINSFFHIPNGLGAIIFWLVAPIFLLISSAWIAFKNRQV